MDTIRRQNPEPRVVLVADVITSFSSTPLSIRRDLEQTDDETLEVLISSMHRIGRQVVHYNSPHELAKHASEHMNDVVLTIYGGDTSRNRMALVPAICEAFGISFIGPDVYGRIIAQDKEISKRLALDCGLLTPPWRVIRNSQDTASVQSLTYPCIVKPLYEGSSIGITSENLVEGPLEAERIAHRLLSDLKVPLIVEEFVSGRETAFVAIERHGSVIWAYSEIVVDGHPEFFVDRIFDAEEKQNPRTPRTASNIDEQLSDKDRIAIEKFLSYFGKFGYCRVDGRHSNERFHFIEFTPDAWIHPRGQFAMGYTERGWTYDDVIAAVLASAT